MSVSGLEFKARGEKLRKEQKERLQRKAAKTELERAAAQRVQERLAIEQESKRRARIAIQQRQESVRQKEEAHAAQNQGVLFTAQLRAVPLLQENMHGIRRSADKVLLSSSVGTSLLQQGASVNGSPFFHIQTPSGASTHVGVLSYEAADGTIALPPKVMRSLWGPTATAESCTSTVKVTYVRLERGSYVKFQPRQAAFQKAVGDNVRECLEASLATHSCLSTGDWLQVSTGEEVHDLCVLSLQPASAVSIIDTEMEAEVQPSVETESKLAAAAEAEAERARQLADLEAEQTRRAEAAVRQAAKEAAAEQQAAVDAEAVSQSKRAALPAEPSTSASEPLVTCVLRFPDGRRAQRRFRISDALQSLFDFSDAWASGKEPAGGYQLVALMPRRLLHPSLCSQHVTLQQAGLQHGSETLMLEPLPCT